MTFTLTAVVKSKGRENEFRGLFKVREVIVSRTYGCTKKDLMTGYESNTAPN
jgi:hypothetical protein